MAADGAEQRPGHTHLMAAAARNEGAEVSLARYKYWRDHARLERVARRHVGSGSELHPGAAMLGVAGSLGPSASPSLLNKRPLCWTIET